MSIFGDICNLTGRSPGHLAVGDLSLRRWRDLGNFQRSLLPNAIIICNQTRPISLSSCLFL